MIFGHGQRRQAADQAAQRFAETREAVLVALGEQEARWRHRTPWLLPLAFVAGFLVKRSRPGRKLWRLARAMMLIGDWLDRRDPVYRKP
jgi:hypothetical protein